MSKNLPAHPSDQMLPPILAGSFTPHTRRRVEQFFFSVASCFESWVTRRQSPHTQRAYREDFMAFVKFLGIQWPMEAWKILTASIKDVQDLLGYRHITTTQIYDKRRRSTSESASHDVPI